MAVLIDPPMWPAHGRRWSHLASDVSLVELHGFARRLGVPARGFEGDHYDLPEERYPAAVAAGAIPVSSRELLRRLRASGLRRPKRRGERVLASRHESAGYRVDTLESVMEPTGVLAGCLVIVETGRRLLVLPDEEGYLLPAQSWLAAALPVLDGETPARRVGYLRRVPPTGSGWTALQVMHRVLPAGPPPMAHPPATWVPARRAAALLPADVAPLVGAVLERRRPG
jgi:hypothetical protein